MPSFQPAPPKANNSLLYSILALLGALLVVVLALTAVRACTACHHLNIRRRPLGSHYGPLQWSLGHLYSELTSPGPTLCADEH